MFHVKQSFFVFALLELCIDKPGGGVNVKTSAAILVRLFAGGIVIKFAA